jgi:hypothetical protein
MSSIQWYNQIFYRSNLNPKILDLSTGFPAPYLGKTVPYSFRSLFQAFKSVFQLQLDELYLTAIENLRVPVDRARRVIVGKLETGS